MQSQLPTAKAPRDTKRSLFVEASIVAGIALFLAVVMPLLIPAFRLKLLGRFLALAIAALGIDLIWGYTGLLSLGHGIFFALGGYAIAMYLKLNGSEAPVPKFFSLYDVSELPFFWKPFYSFPFTAIAIVLIPALVAGLLGYLVFRNRIRGVYFSILTQAALLIFFNFFNGQQELINGTNGLKTDKDSIFGMVVSSERAQITLYILTIVFLALTYALCRWLTTGRFGRLLVAIRDDETRVRFTGYDPTLFKVFVFSISGAIAGLAGALYVPQTGIITPNIMEVAFSIEMVIWVAVGGRGTLIGAIIGTLLTNFAQTFLSEQYPAIWTFFQGALFLLVVTVLPDGLMGLLKNARSLPFLRPKLVTYPQIEENPEVQQEREKFE